MKRNISSANLMFAGVFVVAVYLFGCKHETDPIEIPSPRNFYATASDTQITLTWKPPQKADGYTYILYQGEQQIELSPQAGTYTLQNLENGRTYPFSLEARDASGNKSSQVLAEATPYPADVTPTEEYTARFWLLSVDESPPLRHLI